MGWPSDHKEDSYTQAFSGAGTNFDRSTTTKAQNAALMQQQEQYNLYLMDGFARRIVDTVPEEMTRGGFEIENLDETLEETICAKLEALKISKVLNEAVRWARLFGGAVIVIGANDGGTLELPLNVDGVRDVEFLRVYDRWQATILRRIDDPMNKEFGKPELWQISPVSGGMPYTVHNSRIIMIDGEALPERERWQNQGWGASTLQQCQAQLTRFGMAQVWANMILERNQQAIHKIPDLSRTLTIPGGTKAVQDRVNVVDMVRGILNTVVVDSLEDYDIKTQTMTGIPDIMDRFAEALSAVSGIPVFVLMGRSKGGLSNTGASELETWYAKIGAMQNDILRDPLMLLVSLLLTGNSATGWKICFKPLYVPSKTECADICLKEAQAAKADMEAAQGYVNMQALDPQEVRLTIAEKYKIDVNATVEPLDNETNNQTSEKLAIA